MLLLTFIEEVILLTFDMLQLLVLVRHLRLLGFHCLSLCLLIVGILAHETQATVHLIKVLRREDEHQLILHRAVTRHVAHRLDVFVLTVLQLCLQRVELRVEDADVAVDMMDILLNAVDVLLVLVNIAIDHHQFIQFLADISLVLLQRFLLLTNLPLNIRALALQFTD